MLYLLFFQSGIRWWCLTQKSHWYKLTCVCLLFGQVFQVPQMQWAKVAVWIRSAVAVVQLALTQMWHYGSFFWNCCWADRSTLTSSRGQEKKANSNFWTPRLLLACGASAKTKPTWITTNWAEPCDITTTKTSFVKSWAKNSSIGINCFPHSIQVIDVFG